MAARRTNSSLVGIFSTSSIRARFQFAAEQAISSASDPKDQGQKVWFSLQTGRPTKRKGRPFERPLLHTLNPLEGGFNFETPSFKKGLRDVFRVLVAPRPLPQASRAQVLIV